MQVLSTHITGLFLKQHKLFRLRHLLYENRLESSTTNLPFNLFQPPLINFLLEVCYTNSQLHSDDILHKEAHTLTPSLVIAEHGWICHCRSRIEWRLRPSAISLAGAELNRSCLLANINTGTPVSFSSSNSSPNSQNFNT